MTSVPPFGWCSSSRVFQTQDGKRRQAEVPRRVAVVVGEVPPIGRQVDVVDEPYADKRVPIVGVPEGGSRAYAIGPACPIPAP